MIWYIEDYRRNRLEREKLEALAASVDWLLPVRWRIDDSVRLIWDADIVAGGHTFPVSLRYPNHFPYSPPVVLPRGSAERWSMHQYGSGGELCLEFGPDNWHTAITGAEMMQSAYRLLHGERPSPDERAIVASRHETTLGQELRGKFTRFLATRALADVAANIPDDVRLSVKVIGMLHEDSYVNVIASIALLDGTTWSEELPQPFKVGYQRTVSLCRWPDSVALPDTTTLTGFRAAIAGRMSAVPEGELYTLLVHKNRLSAYFLDNDADSVITLSVVPPQADAARMDADHVELGNRLVGIVGCGSLGSKVATMLARAGVKRFLLVDDDIVFPDNFVRHDLDWRDVGTHKADSVAARIQLVNPRAECEKRKHRLGGQESSGSIEALIERLAACDLIVDATAEPSVFTYLAAAAGFGKKPLLWAEVFGGGIGGIIARHRPTLEPDPATMKLAIENWCANRGKPIERATTDYGGGEGVPAIADDADVTVIAAHAARLGIDTLIPRALSLFPNSVYLVGLAPGWIFDQPFETYPIDVGPPPPTAEPEVETEEMSEELARVLRLFAEHKNEANPVQPGAEPPS